VDLADIIGQYLSKDQIYLQDPINYKRNVLYRNPYIILKDMGIIITDSFKIPQGIINIKYLGIRLDLLV
jgi:hypothetical protein